jgi:dolichol-phosphate mannosyltransferase
MNKKVSVIIPTYNEKDNILILLPRLLQKNCVAQIIIVDDGSKDGTIEVINDYMRKDSRVLLIERGFKQGIGSAYKEGIKKATCDFIITMDADLSHDPSDIERFLKEIEDADVVIGSRHVNGAQIIGWNVYRYLTHYIANLLAKILLNINCSDVTSGYRAYKRNIIKSVIKIVKSEKFNFQLETIFYINKLNFKIKEVPIKFINRRKGKSKFNINEAIDFLKLLIYLFPLRFK